MAGFGCPPRKAREDSQPNHRAWKQRQRTEQHRCLARCQRPLWSHTSQRWQINAARRVFLQVAPLHRRPENCAQHIVYMKAHDRGLRAGAPRRHLLGEILLRLGQAERNVARALGTGRLMPGRSARSLSGHARCAVPSGGCSERPMANRLPSGSGARAEDAKGLALACPDLWSRRL
jgi:hypothetical protein